MEQVTGGGHKTHSPSEKNSQHAGEEQPVEDKTREQPGVGRR